MGRQVNFKELIKGKERREKPGTEKMKKEHNTGLAFPCAFADFETPFLIFEETLANLSIL